MTMGTSGKLKGNEDAAAPWNRRNHLDEDLTTSEAQL